MEEKFDVIQALWAFNLITTKGEKDGSSYHYFGLTAWSDVDGYTATLSDGVVTLTINFHSTWEFDTDNGRLIDVFIQKLQKIVPEKTN